MADRRAWVCQEIVRDMERDVAAFDGRPLDGRTVAEIHATLAAAISALAGVVETLLPQSGEDRPDPETGEPLPAGVEGHPLGGRQVTRCPAVYPNRGQCWDSPHPPEVKHHVGSDDEYDEGRDFEWTDEQAAEAAAKLAAPPEHKCYCGRVFDDQAALDAHVAAEEEPEAEQVAAAVPQPDSPDLPPDIGPHADGLVDAGLEAGIVEDFMDGSAR